MAQISMPAKLRELLEDSDLSSTVGRFCSSAGEILADNQMPFFPAFTAHGLGHADAVLRASVELIPSQVWEDRLLGAADAATLVCAVVLHDLGMHVREHGFAALVAADTPFSPIPFFDEPHGTRLADAPWPDLWSSFQREAQHFGSGHLDLILGAVNDGVPAVAFADEIKPGALTMQDRLLIGEFLRRHHARLSHEIAVTGFPGADGLFPVLAAELPAIGDLIGAVARSHTEDLRFMLEYLKDLDSGNRPKGVLAAYLMGVLRVADYVQIQSERAPPLLLRLKAPQSRISIDEWNKHRAVDSMSWDAGDPYAITVSVSSHHELRTHLALKELLEDMQVELDKTWAVLDEHYGSSSLSALCLSRRRVVSNIDWPSLHRKLPYVPRRATLRSDPDLFRLMVRALYGDEPHVAGRELVQNSADATRARRHWESSHGPIPPERFPALESDIVVTLDKEDKDGKRLVLRVRDCGIGMSADTVVEYYLAAGASYGASIRDIEAMDRDEAISAMKTGRFGVGVFAAFLLGPEVRVTTRHVEERRGLQFRAHIDEELVQINWTGPDALFGTTVEISFEASILERLMSPKFLVGLIAGTYRLKSPTVTFLYEGEPIPPYAEVPDPDEHAIDDGWFKVETDLIEAAYWRLPSRPAELPIRLDDDDDDLPFTSLDPGDFIHNGIIIERPLSDEKTGGYRCSDIWLTLKMPAVAAFDPRHTVGVALHRFELVDETLPFESDLLKSITSNLAAHALICGNERHSLLTDRRERRPLTSIHTADGFVPPVGVLSATDADRWELHACGDTQESGDPVPQGLQRWLEGSRKSHTCRCIGGPPSVSPFSPGRSRRLATSLHEALVSVREESLDLGRYVHAGQAAAVVVAKDLPDGVWDGRTRATIPDRSWGWSIGGEWRWHGQIPRGSAHVFVVGPRDVAVSEDAIETAIDFWRKRRINWLCLTILSDSTPSAAARTVADRWRSLIGGFVPSDPERRAAVATDMERRFPETRPHLDYWRAIAEGG